MILPPEQYSRLMRFMDAEMSQEEMEAFDAELNENDELRQQLQFEQSIRDGFLLQKMRKPISAGITVNGSVRQLPVQVKRKVWLTAAAIIISLGIGLLIFKKEPAPPLIVKKEDHPPQVKKDSLLTKQTPEQTDEKIFSVNTDSLFKKNFTKEPVPDEYPLYLAQAFDDYTAGDYHTLDKLRLDELRETRGIEDEKKNILLFGHFYKGMAALEKKNGLLAKEHLNWVARNAKTEGWKQKAHWYLAMAALQTADIKTTRTELELTLTSPLYRTRAKQILQIITTK